MNCDGPGLRQSWSLRRQCPARAASWRAKGRKNTASSGAPIAAPKRGEVATQGEAMSQADDVAEYASEEDLLYKEIGRESVKKTAGFLSDTLRHFVTLNATLLGGSVALLGPDVVHPAFRVGVATLFLASLALACTVCCRITAPSTRSDPQGRQGVQGGVPEAQEPLAPLGRGRAAVRVARAPSSAWSRLRRVNSGGGDVRPDAVAG